MNYLFLCCTQHVEHLLTRCVIHLKILMNTCTGVHNKMEIVKGYNMILSNWLRTRCNLWWYIRHLFCFSLVVLRATGTVQSDYKIWKFITQIVRNTCRINKIDLSNKVYRHDWRFGIFKALRNLRIAKFMYG